MDTRDTAEQAELRRAAAQLASELGPAGVADLDDAARSTRLARAVRAAGWLELRDAAEPGSDDGRVRAPLASGVEAGIVADALGGAVADVAFSGPVLAADLLRRAGLPTPEGAAVAFAGDLAVPTPMSSTRPPSSVQRTCSWPTTPGSASGRCASITRRSRRRI